MTCFQKILKLHSVSREVAARWSNLPLVSIHDACDIEEDDDELMFCWGLWENLFPLASKMNIPASKFFTDNVGDELHSSALHSQLMSAIADGRDDVENRCGWELHNISEYGEWLRQTGYWCPQELKDICDCLDLKWLDCLNGLCAEWKLLAREGK